MSRDIRLTHVPGHDTRYSRPNAPGSWDQASGPAARPGLADRAEAAAAGVVGLPLRVRRGRPVVDPVALPAGFAAAARSGRARRRPTGVGVSAPDSSVLAFRRPVRPLWSVWS